MADMRGSAAVCDDKCGCPYPCPGGTRCRCASGGGDGSTVEHKQCSCGDHCGCNPCGCSESDTRGTGKAYCRCGDACTCPTCAA